eukprot:2550622-Amphidinium_carterae.1
MQQPFGIGTRSRFNGIQTSWRHSSQRRSKSPSSPRTSKAVGSSWSRLFSKPREQQGASDAVFKGRIFGFREANFINIISVDHCGHLRRCMSQISTSENIECPVNTRKSESGCNSTNGNGNIATTSRAIKNHPCNP